MYVADLENLVIHDLSFIRFECKTNKTPADKKKKIFNISTVKRMVEPDHVPKFNGCQHCLSEYHTFDFTKLFS